MRVNIKKSDAPNTIIKYQTLFHNGPETSQSLEWIKDEFRANLESKHEFKNNFTYLTDRQAHIQNMLSTTNIRLAGPRTTELSSGLNNQLDSVKKDATRNTLNQAKGSGFTNFKSFSQQKSPILTSPARLTKISSIERSPKSQNSRMSSFQNMSVHQISTNIKQKLNWHIDQEALLNSKQFKQLIGSIRDSPHFEDSEAKDISASMLHMKSYFETLLQRLFYENKAKFTSSSYFKSLFAEEFGKDSIKRSHSSLDDFPRKTPVCVI
jgi:hypothetical protein